MEGKRSLFSNNNKSKIKIAMVIFLGLFFLNTIIISANFKLYNTDIKQDSEMNTDNGIVNEPFTTQQVSLTNNTLSASTAISFGEQRYFVLNDIPSRSAKYYFGAYQSDPNIVRVTVYAKFNAVPSISDFDYFVPESLGQWVYRNVEVPGNNMYGDLHIMLRCTYGGGLVKAIARYVEDNNGRWQRSNYKSTPRYGEAPISFTDTVDGTDTNDFFAIHLYSGQELVIDAEAITGFTFHGFLYDSNYILLASDTSGVNVDITYQVTAFEEKRYYLQFRCYGDYLNFYTCDISDANSDTNNRYDDADDNPALNLTTSGYGYLGVMDNSDFNDYWYFNADSGEHIQITVTIDNPVDSPHFDIFLYGDFWPYDNYYIKHDDIGTILTIDYYCSGFRISDLQGEGNLYYLRIWNAALVSGMSDSAAGYTITLTRSYANPDDYIGGAVDYTTWGNNTTPKSGNLNGEEDNNDWFSINTKAGNLIVIRVNWTDSDPSPDLDGFLYDNNKKSITGDFYGNMTINYIADYTGNYYFRLFQNRNSYLSIVEYSWYIYTCTYVDNNGDFSTANVVNPTVTINGEVSFDDIDDYFIFEVPAQYDIILTGTSSYVLLLYLYDFSQSQLASDYSSWSTNHYHSGFETEIYYVRVYNYNEQSDVTYTLTITLSITDTDEDGLSDYSENNEYFTDPNDSDSDDDELSDWEELAIYNTDPNDSDSDDDDLSDYQEVITGTNGFFTNPNDPDSDDDGLTDFEEAVFHLTNPNDEDNDDDGLLDGEEINTFYTNPHDTDSDDDGITDYVEVYTYYTNPNDEDSDHDGLDDWEEVTFGDDDYLTDPNDPDTDDDGITDYVEVDTYHTDPTDEDSDDDGLDDWEEVTFGDDGYLTDPNDEDTDDDGATDYQEFVAGTDPTDPNNYPTTVVGGIGHIITFATFVSSLAVFSIIKLLNRRRKS